MHPSAPVTPPAPSVPAGPSRALQHIPAALMVIVSLLVAGFGAALIFCKIPTENAQALTQGGTLIVGAFISIVSFYFGSSKSSQAKDDTIAKQLGA